VGETLQKLPKIVFGENINKLTVEHICSS